MPNSTDANADSDATLRFGPMRLQDVSAVVAIEAASFPSPWNHGHFIHELKRNPYSVNRVLRRGERVIGYVSVWILDRELQVNKVALERAERGKGLGRRLLERLLALARETHCRRVTLEVRPGNVAARALYQRLGFFESGRRVDYYGPGEHAILMQLEFAAAGGV